jgi:hypothetical protein
MARRDNCFGGWLAAGLVLGACGAQTATALEPYELSPSHMQAATAHSTYKRAPFKVVGNAGQPGPAAATGAVPGLDMVVNFTGQFYAPGVDSNGNPQSVWYYSMVGNSPELGGSTVVAAPIIPVTVDLLDQEGEVRRVNGHHLVQKGSLHLTDVLQSPVFQNFSWSSSRTPTQYTDAVQRATFWSSVQEDEENPWHTILNPMVQQGRTIKVPYGKYFFALNPDGTCCAFVLIDDPTFSNLLFPASYPVDSSTVMGWAELNGIATTKSILTLLFTDVYLYENGDPNQCCVLGFHGPDVEPGIPANGNLPRLYAMNYASWVSPGLFPPGFQDVVALSHELAETINDPIAGADGVHNFTPWHLAPFGLCQNILEVGDVIEGLANATYPVSLNNFTYHPQTVALLPWFEFKRPSHAIDGAYSYPDTTVLTSLSPPEKVNCQ